MIESLLSRLIGVASPTPSLAPPGEDPVGYLILLTVFGFTLIAARTATGSLYAASATHLTFLTVNRLTLLRRRPRLGLVRRTDRRPTPSC